MAAVVTSLLECLRYTLVRHLESDDDNRTIQDFLVNEQVTLRI